MAGSWFRQSQQSLHRCQTTVTVLSTSRSWHCRAKLRADGLPATRQVRGACMGWQLRHQQGTSGDSNFPSRHRPLPLASAPKEWIAQLCPAQSSAVLPSPGVKGLLCPANTEVNVLLMILNQSHWILGEKWDHCKVSTSPNFFNLK